MKDEKNESKVSEDRKEYYDVKGKADTSDEELLKYILNIYATMCTRGMRGTYIYVCDSKLKEHLSKYIDKYLPDDNGITYSVNEEDVDHTVHVAEDSEEYNINK